MQGSFNNRVRQTIEGAFKLEEIFTNRQIGDLLELCTDERRNRLGGALKDLSKYGELEHLGPGRWRRLGREERPELKQIIWGLLRIYRVMTVEKMALLSGASPHNVHNWFKSALRLELVQNEAGKGKIGRYRLIKDIGPTLPADGNGERLKRLRAGKKQREALVALDAAFSVVARECPGKTGESLRRIVQARRAVCQMEEG